jgi:hypothetical protein
MLRSSPPVRRSSVSSFITVIAFATTCISCGWWLGSDGRIATQLRHRHRTGKLLPRVLVLSTLTDDHDHLPAYFDALRNLTYPAHLLSLGLLETGSTDKPSPHEISTLLQMNHRLDDFVTMSGTMAAALIGLERFRSKGWRSLSVTPHDLDDPVSARNYLCMAAMQEDIEWVLWLDASANAYPPDALMRLLDANRDIVTANVRDDAFSWRSADSPGDDATPQEVVSYQSQGPRLAMRKIDGEIIRLDAVGARFLLVRADLHRKGLVFPPFSYNGYTGVEAFSDVALHMGTLSYGVTSVHVG